MRLRVTFPKTMRCIDMRSGTPVLRDLPAVTPAQRRLIALNAVLYRRWLAIQQQSPEREGGVT